MEPLTFYFDRCFGRRFPEALNWVRPPFKVEYHDGKKFPKDMKDDEWLAIAGKNNWVVFSHDQKFHSETTESFAVRQFKVRCFYLYGANLKTWDKITLFIKAYPRIMERLAKKQREPLIFNIGKSGRIQNIKLTT